MPVRAEGWACCLHSPRQSPVPPTPGSQTVNEWAEECCKLELRCGSWWLFTLDSFSTPTSSEDDEKY